MHRHDREPADRRQERRQGATHERLARLLDGFAGLRVMVVGDFGLDHYLVGDAGRILREFPVVILTHKFDEYHPGSPANTVANPASLGATVIPVGLIGADPNGDELLKLLARSGCDADTIVHHATFRTVTKTRIAASGTHGGGLDQDLLRADWLGQALPAPPPKRNSCAASRKRRTAWTASSSWTTGRAPCEVLGE